MPVSSVAFVGLVGGAGTTRTVLELGGVLARGGRSALILDLDFATQGLENRVEERVEPDAAALLAEPEHTVREAMIDWDVDGEGALHLVPAYAPFATIAEAKTAEAGKRVETRITDALDHVDHVLLDVPPLVENQAIGAVTAAESVVAVMPPSDRGVNALQRERGRVADVDADLDGVLAVGTTADAAPPDADLAVPELPGNAPSYRPVTLQSDAGTTARFAEVASALFDVDLAETVDAAPSMVDRVKRTIPR